ncbi:MAG: caspase family protein [Deltaproteobacteria bacterium]|nr:caspase family protein [Deltaproteobacteria bacterium]
MKPLIRIGFLLLFSLGFSAAHAATQRFALVLGNNLGSDSARRLQFAEADANKVATVLRELGGFTAGNVELLIAARAEQVWSKLQVLAERARRAIARGDRAVLLFYYSGHADGDVLELADTSLSLKRLAEFMKGSRATVRLAFIDSCKSGSLIHYKGGRRGPAFQLRLDDEIAASGYAIVTSSAHDELSQEATEIRGSYFSHYVVSGLRGGADASGDGTVTLSELYRYAYARTVARTSASVGGPQHPMYSYRLVGRGEIVLSRPQRALAALRLVEARSGRLVVLDQQRETVVAERQIVDGQRAELALAPDRYALYVVGDDERVWRGQVQLTRGKLTTVEARSLVPHRPRLAVAKGGLFSAVSRRPIHELSTGATLRRSPLNAHGALIGAQLDYRLIWRSGITVGSELAYGHSLDRQSDGLNELGAFLGVGYRLALTRAISTDLDLRLGYEHLFQTTTQHTSGVAYHGQLSFAVATAIGAVLKLGLLAGGRTFRDGDRGLTTRVDLRGMLGVGFPLGAKASAERRR